MLHPTKRGRYLPLIGLALAGLAACGPSEEIQQQLAELTTISAEKDSLVAQVAANTRLMSDISAELARVSAPVAEAGATEPGAQPDPGAILADIQALTVRVTESEERLLESQRRIATLSRESRTQSDRIAEFQRTVEEFQATIESQKQTITTLTEQVTFLQEENARLAAVNVALADTVTALDSRQNSVWYLIGSKDELLERGVIREEGGSRVLFVFGKRGKTLVPARDLDLSAFSVADGRYLREIALPDTEAKYTVVTRQDLSALDATLDEDGRIRDASLRIADPDRFWAGGRILIVVHS